MIKTTLISFVLFGATNVYCLAQCNPTEFVDECKAHLNEDRFLLVKEFPIVTKNGEYVEHSFTLTDIADYEYYFTGDAWDHQTMVASIFGPDRKKLASNRTDSEVLHSIKFHPPKAGIYYIRFTFEAGASFCGMSVLGFHRHTKS